MLIKLGVEQPHENVGSYAPIAFGGSLLHTTGHPAKRPKLALTQHPQSPWVTAPPQHHNGPHKANRSNNALCEAYQSGSCSQATQGNKCPADPAKVHQCSTCLSDRHGANNCHGKSKGKGKLRGNDNRARGKGKGKGKKGNRY